LVVLLVLAAQELSAIKCIISFSNFSDVSTKYSSNFAIEDSTWALEEYSDDVVED